MYKLLSVSLVASILSLGGGIQVASNGDIDLSLVSAAHAAKGGSERAAESRNEKSQLRGMNSAVRNENGIANSNDAKMDEIRNGGGDSGSSDSSSEETTSTRDATSTTTSTTTTRESSIESDAGLTELF